MESENILKYVQDVGYRTLDEIKATFSSDGSKGEVLDAVITFLVERNKIRKVKFQAPSREAKILFYVVSNE